MANGIDTAMNLMQPSATQPAFNPTRTQSELEQLPPRHHPMLPLRQLRDRSIHRG
jgi:hypothetical protein